MKEGHIIKVALVVVILGAVAIFIAGFFYTKFAGIETMKAPGVEYPLSDTSDESKSEGRSVMSSGGAPPYMPSAEDLKTKMKTSFEMVQNKQIDYQQYNGMVEESIDNSIRQGQSLAYQYLPGARKAEGYTKREVADKSLPTTALKDIKFNVKHGLLYQLLQSKPYKRDAEFSIQVDDAIKTERSIETMLKEYKGELLALSLQGSKTGRQGSLAAYIPVDYFNTFVDEVRRLGEILSENITVVQLPEQKPGIPPATPNDLTQRGELTLVKISFNEATIVKAENKGIIAGSFSNSITHFLKGSAVIIEGLGYLLPFLVLLAIIGACFYLLAKLKRKEQTVAATYSTKHKEETKVKEPKTSDDIPIVKI